jgi:hypothetical protein
MEEKMHLVKICGKEFVVNGALTKAGAVRVVTDRIASDAKKTCQVLDAGTLLKMVRENGLPEVIEAKQEVAPRPAVGNVDSEFTRVLDECLAETSEQSVLTGPVEHETTHNGLSRPISLFAHRNCVG